MIAWAALQGHALIELIPCGQSDTAKLIQVLDRAGFQAQIVETGCDQLGAGFKKDRTLWGRVLKKLSLDFPKKIALKPRTTKVVFMNIPNHLARDYYVARLPKEKLILFMWEPYIRLRKMYNPKLQACFGRIYTWDDDLVDNQNYFKFYYPVLKPMLTDLPEFKKKKFCTLISACTSEDKYPQKYPNELYSERRRAAEFFEKVGEPGFDLFGRGWEKDRYTSYRGAPADKIAVLKNYRFAICYENCQGVKGYITEKIFDCFQAGVVPIYWGAPNVTDYIPSDCFIDRRNFATYDDLYAFLKAMTQTEYEGYLERIRTYLKSSKAQLFSFENYEKIFVEAMSSQDA